MVMIITLTIDELGGCLRDFEWGLPLERWLPALVFSGAVPALPPKRWKII